MAHQWHPEAVVDEELARELIAAQFAPLPERSVELVAAGWDYTVFRVDDDWAFRFPRREIVLEPMQRELAVLPVLAPLLPVAVPAPVYVGRPSHAFRWPFYGARWLPGADAASVELSGDDRVALAQPLAGFLRRLHAPDLLDALPGLPVDPMGRGDPAVRVPRTRDELAAAAAEGLWETPAAVFELLSLAEQLPPREPSVVCHGDLHLRQVLVDGARLRGVVDWVDVCRGDPGIDLILAYTLLPSDARPAFFAEYGPVADESLVRARVLAFNLSAVLARYGRDQGLRRLEREAVASLGRAAEDL